MIRVSARMDNEAKQHSPRVAYIAVKIFFERVGKRACTNTSTLVNQAPLENRHGKASSKPKIQ